MACLSPDLFLDFQSGDSLHPGSVFAFCGRSAGPKRVARGLGHGLWLRASSRTGVRAFGMGPGVSTGAWWNGGG